MSAGTLACGGAPEAKSATATAAPSSASPPKAPPIDLAAVPAPESLGIVVRFARPTETLTVAGDLLRNAWPPASAVTVKDVMTLAVGDAIADVVDYSRSIDAAFTLKKKDNGGDVVVSLAVLSFDDAMKNLAEDYALTPRGNGVIALMPLGSEQGAQSGPAARKRKQGKKDKGDDGDGDERASKVVCELWPSAGDAPYRLLCGFGAAPILALGSYLTRTVARTSTSSDLHVEFLPGIVRMAVNNVVNKREPTSSPSYDAGAAFGQRIMVDLFKEIRSLSGDATISRAQSEATLTAHFLSSDAVGAQLLGADPTRVKATPRAFFQLPADASIAFYAQGTKPDALAAFREEAVGLMEKDALDDATDTEVTRKMFESLRKLTFRGGPFVVATGFDDTALRKAIAAKAPKSGVTPIPRSALHGWTLVESDGGVEPWVIELRGIMAYEKAHPSQKGTTAKDGTPRKERTDIREVAVTKQEGLPASAAHFESRTTPLVDTTTSANGAKPAKPAAPHSFHFYFVDVAGPDGPQGWFAAGEDAAVVRAKLQVALMTTATAPTQLGSRTGLEALRTDATSWGGLIGSHGAPWFDLPDAPPTDADGAGHVGEIVSKLAPAQKPDVPVLVTAEASKEKGAAAQGGTQLAIRVRFPRAATDALIQLGSDEAKR